MILVIGATGMVGSEVVSLLKANQKTVRVMVRPTSDTSKVQKLKGLGVQVVIGDLKDTSTFNSALKDVEVVITTTSSMPFSYIPGKNDIQLVDLKGMMNLIDHANSAGVKHFIYTSFSGQIDLDFPLRNAKRIVENHLKQTDMTYTILRPSCFMEVWLSPAVGFDVENAKVQLCGEGTNPVSYISLRDVAQFAVHSLDNPAAKNAVLELGGPQPLSQLDAVHIFEQLQDRKFVCQSIPKTALQSQLETSTDPMEKSFAGLMLCVANGDPIPMDKMLKAFPIKLTSVKEFAQSLVPVS